MRFMSRINIFMTDTLEGGFSPLHYRSQFDLWGMASLYQGICMYDETLNLCNRLSEYVIFEDGYLEVKLKPLVWHDGTTISAEDFKFSFELYFRKSKKGRIPNGIIQRIEGAEDYYYDKTSEIAGIKVIDDHTFRIYHHAPHQYMQSLLVLPILPKRNNPQAENKNIGCGAYVLQAMNKSSARFERNENFCLGSPKMKYLDLLGGSKEDQKELLKTKSIDLTAIEATDLLNLPFTVFHDYYMYSLPQPVSTVMKINPKSELFTNLGMRKTLSQSIDRNLLVQKLFHGFADPLLQFYPPVVAQQLNCTLLYPDVAPCNVRCNEIIIGFQEKSAEHILVAELLYEQLKNQTIVSLQSFTSREEAYSCGADVYIDSMSHSIIPISNPFIYSNSKYFSTSSDYDQMINLEQKLYSKNYRHFTRDFATECARVLPIIPLYSKHEIQLVSKRVKGLKPDTRGAFWNIHEIEII